MRIRVCGWKLLLLDDYTVYTGVRSEIREAEVAWNWLYKLQK